MDLSLLDFFYQLREQGLPLSIEQYYCVARHLIELASENSDLKADFPKIKRVCQTVWVKSPDQRKLFETVWEAMRDREQPQVQPILEPSPKSVTEIKPFASPPPIPKTELKLPISPYPYLLQPRLRKSPPPSSGKSPRVLSLKTKANTIPLAALN